MEKNVGRIDKYVRVILGLVLLLVAALHSLGLEGVSRGIVALLGIILIFTAFSGFCPLYGILDKSSRG